MDAGVTPTRETSWSRSVWGRRPPRAMPMTITAGADPGTTSRCRLAHDVVARPLHESLPTGDDRGRVSQGPASRPTTDITGRERLGAQAGDDGEVAATTTAQGPEEIRIPFAVNGFGDSVRGHHLHLDDAVAGQPMGPVEDTEATALGQPSQPDGGAGAGRQAAAVSGQRGVDVDQLCARRRWSRWPTPRRSRPTAIARVSTTRPPGDRGRPEVGVPAATRHERYAVAPGEADGLRDVGGAGRPHDRGRRHRVPPRVVELVGDGEAGRAGPDQRTIQAGGQRRPVGRGRWPGSWPSSRLAPAGTARAVGAAAGCEPPVQPASSPAAAAPRPASCSAWRRGQAIGQATRPARPSSGPARPTPPPAGHSTRSVSRASCRITTAATWSTTAPALALPHPRAAQRLLGAHGAQPLVDQPHRHRGRRARPARSA